MHDAHGIHPAPRAGYETQALGRTLPRDPCRRSERLDEERVPARIRRREQVRGAGLDEPPERSLEGRRNLEIKVAGLEPRRRHEHVINPRLHLLTKFPRQAVGGIVRCRMTAPAREHIARCSARWVALRGCALDDLSEELA